MIGTSKEKLITVKVHLLKEEDDGGETIGKKLDITKITYQFKDSFAFLKSSLTTLASNLEKKDLVSVYDFFTTLYIVSSTAL